MHIQTNASDHIKSVTDSKMRIPALLKDMRANMQLNYIDMVFNPSIAEKFNQRTNTSTLADTVAN